MPASHLYLGDCRDIMAEMDAESVDTIITDPPYGLTENKRGGSGVGPINLESPYGRARIGTGNGSGGFMGQKWDAAVPDASFWAAALRVAKPGAFLLAFGGTRTYHRLACAIEDAGWEIRDTLMWVYGSGFPKSLDIAKSLDKRAGAEREVIGSYTGTFGTNRTRVEQGYRPSEVQPGALTLPATAEAVMWDGWGTALKPAWEPIVVAMKPTVGTFADNALTYGVSGIWIDGARIGDGDEMAGLGRWPANVVLSHHPDCNGTCHRDCPVRALDEQSGVRQAGARPAKRAVSHFGNGHGTNDGDRIPYDSGGASRFFYCAKASVAERDAGLDDLPLTERPGVLKMREDGSLDGKPTAARKNSHPTVKPVSLMRWLCRLTKTPTGGNVFDPFMGSGSTGCAAALEGRDFAGAEVNPDYMAIAAARIEHWRKQAETEPCRP